MPNWSQPCLMTVQVGPHLGAGGATTFVFDRGEVYGWRMTIQGSAERVLDSVLPHEITHMIFASHFRRPLPRWADEGGATSVEHPSEKAKHQQMLVQFLHTGRGIAFNQMFAMTEYPPDVMPLYAQGYSLAEYLIEQGGRRKYVQFLATACTTNDWAAAVQRSLRRQRPGRAAEHLAGLGAPGLAATWQPRASRATALAAVGCRRCRPRPEPNLIYRLRKDGATWLPGLSPAGQRRRRLPCCRTAAVAGDGRCAAAGRRRPKRLPAEGAVCPGNQACRRRPPVSGLWKPGSPGNALDQPGQRHACVRRG